MTIQTVLANWRRINILSTGRSVGAALLKLLPVVVLGCWSVAAQAESGGITGYSDDPNTGPANCSSCHSGGSFSYSASIGGPTLVAPNSTNSFSFDLNGSGASGAGLDLSVTSGTLHSASGTQILSGELTHTAPQNIGGGDASWSFTYTAPGSGAVTMYACGNPVNLNGNQLGDGPPACTTKTVNINTNPNAVNDSFSVNKNSVNNSFTTVLNNDTSGSSGNDPGDSISVTSVGAASHGTATRINGTTVRYTPTAGFSGSDSFTYTITDSVGATDTATVSVTVVNHAPVANADAYSTSEDATLNIAAGSGVLANDTDADGDTLTASVVSTTTHGSLTLNSNGSFTYVPTNGYSGADSFTYRASDGSLNSGTVTVSLTVNFVNFAPVATADSYSTNEDATLVIAASGVLANDTDANNDTLSAILVSTTAHGTLTLNSNGGFTYVPTNGYSGADSFSYRASDGSLTSNIVTVSITVNYVNFPPVAVADSYSVNEDATLTVATGNGVLVNDTDANNDALTAALVSTTAHGVLTFNSNGSFTYVPTNGYSGPDSFTYRANDGVNNSNIVTVSITVVYVNFPPVAVADSYSVNEDAILTTTAGSGVLANDTDANSDTLTAAVLATTTHGALTFNSNGSFTYVPTNGYSGPDSFTYRANDGVNNSNIVTVSLTVIYVNFPPIAVADNYSVNEDATLTTTAGNGVLANDTDANNDALTASLLSTTTHGTLTFNSNGSFTYVPVNGYSGSDSFTYRANDGVNNSNIVTVNLTVNFVNFPPVAVADSYSINQDTTLTVAVGNSVLINDTDANNDALTAVLASTAAHGTVTLNSNGSFTYVPAARYRGSDSFTYFANDGVNNSNAATVSITVIPVNHAPVASNDGLYTAFANTPRNVNAASGVLANDTDPDGDVLSAVLLTMPAHGTLTLNSDGSFSYMANPNYLGPDQFTYQASDGSLTSNVATVTLITVQPPPVITVPSDVNINATGYVTAVNLNATATDAHDGTVAVTADTKSPLRPGHHVVTYTAKNSAGYSSVATQNVDIVPLAGVGPDQVTSRGRNVDVDFILNGPAVTYPVTLTYNVSGTATSADTNATNGTVTINSGTSATLQIAIANDGGGAPDRTLIITLASATNAASGANTSSTITIVDRNIAPIVSLGVTQQSQPRARVYGADGLATITATAVDPDVGDTVTYDWTGTDAALLAPTNSQASFTLCPVVSCTGGTTIVPAGNYKVVVKATDSHGASNTSHWTLLVANAEPALTTADSDQDGIDDSTEGVMDSWNTGLADYLNPFDESFVIPDQVSTSVISHPLETEPGLSLHVGSTSLSSGGTGALVVTPPADTAYSRASGVFDFEIRGIPAGGIAVIVLPLQNALGANAVYRQYVASDSSWHNFTANTTDTVSSATAVNGVCPGPESSSWTSGLASGAQCVRLTIMDGGPNDADGTADGVITNFGGAANLPTSSSSSSAAAPASSKGGGALGWPLLLMLAVLVLMMSVRRRPVPKD